MDQHTLPTAEAPRNIRGERQEAAAVAAPAVVLPQVVGIGRPVADRTYPLALDYRAFEPRRGRRLPDPEELLPG